jgi:dolichyl-phosphate-mannose-protein mannosyltransferase
MESPKTDDRSRWEWLAVAALTAIGFGLRSWPVGRLGLNHFDEGIYALVASWSLLPKGLAGIDPSLIPYAPPGYPILGGLAYWVLGRSDGAMIAVSQVAGTLTIPVVAWLGRRTFGPGAGYASATFCAFSGPHIAFSRMALTDASFLLAWLLAIGAGMRFLERPGAARAIVMGLAVGLAQQFKYNGWLTGVIVVGSALLVIMTQPDERKPAAIARTFGWGTLAAGAAWLVVWPWFAFVEAHGGYSALLRHQRGYLGGFRDWWPNLMIQADQAMALSGGNLLLLVPVVFTVGSPWAERPWPRREEGRLVIWLVQVGEMACAISLPWLLSPAPYWLGLVMTPWLLIQDRPSSRLLGSWWLVLSLMTPFYHPYARLWLPYHAANWILMGWLVARGPALYYSYRSRMAATRSGRVTFRLALAAALGLYTLGGVVSIPRLMPGPWATVRRLLKPSDSLYRATIKVSQVLPDSVKGLRLLARPSVTYYLAGRVALYPMADSEALAKPGDPNVWALVDSAILVSEPGRNPITRFAKDWEIVETIRTNPSLPTIFDLDPYAARATEGDWSYPLWLLRPRTSKATQ